MDKLKSQPQIEKFIKEELEWNAKLKQQQEDICHQISVTSSYFDTRKILTQKVANMKLECEKVKKNISDFIQ